MSCGWLLWFITVLLCHGSHMVIAQQQSTVPNDSCNAAKQVLTTPFFDTVNTSRATTDFTEVTCDVVQPTDIGVWYSYTSETDVVIEIAFSDTTFDPRLTVFRGSCDTPICFLDVGFATVYSFVATAGMEYRLLVTGDGATTGRFTIEIRETEKPINDSCETATNVTFPFSRSGSTSGALPDFSELFCDVYPSFRGVWYKYEPNEDRIVTIRTKSFGFFHRITVLTGQSCGQGFLNCDDNHGIAYNSVDLIYRFHAQESTIYYILITSYSRSTDVGAFSISVEEADVPPNDTCENATELDLRSGTNSYSGSNIGAIPEFEDGHCGTNPFVGGDVWYKYTPPVDMNITITTSVAAFAHDIFVLKGQSCIPRPSCEGRADYYSGGSVSITFLATKSSQYFVLITGSTRLTETGTFTLTASSDVVLPTPPPVNVPQAQPQTEMPSLQPESRPLAPAPSRRPNLSPSTVSTLPPVQMTRPPIRSPPTKVPTTRPVIAPAPMRRPNLPPSAAPTLSPVQMTRPPVQSPPTRQPVRVSPAPRSKLPTDVPETDQPVASPLIGTVETCPDGSPGPKFPDECDVDCPARGEPPIPGCVKFCDVRPIFGCAPVCSADVEAILPGGCRERCCRDRRTPTDLPTTTPIESIVDTTDPPTPLPFRPMMLSSNDNGKGKGRKYYDDDDDDDYQSHKGKGRMYYYYNSQGKGKGMGKMHYVGKGKGKMNHHYYAFGNGKGRSEDDDNSSSSSAMRKYYDGWNERRRSHYLWRGMML